MSLSVILLAAGVGSRMKSSTPKQFMSLLGTPVICHTLKTLEQLDCVNEIVVVTLSQYKEALEDLIRSQKFSKKYVILSGGASRQESTYIGLKHVNSDVVLIHEAARPFLKSQDFLDIIQCNSENVTYGLDIPFTVLKGHDVVESLLERSDLINIQLPQKFNRLELLAAHELARIEGREFTEDVSLLYFYTQAKVAVMPGKDYNIKITSPFDLLIGEQILKNM